MTVDPREGPEGSVFRFTGRGWRPGRKVKAYFGPYCRPDDACPAIAYIAFLRTDGRGRFTLRLRAGAERPRDDDRGISAGAHPRFTQRVGRPPHRRTVARAPRYRVIVPPE